MCLEVLKIVFRHNTLDVELAIQGMQSVFAEREASKANFTFRNEPMGLPSVLARLKQTKRRTFNFSGEGFEFMLGSVANHHLDFLRIKSLTPPSIPWSQWLGQFMDHPEFVMAWVVDGEYDYWQNAQDPLEYAAAGKSYSHLPMKSNGLPYPLEQQVIDISANPGRWLFHDGYIEAVGAVMWLGSPFWLLTGADQKQVEDTPWLRVSHPGPSVTKLEATDRCFTTISDPGGELQLRLRTLLFGG